MVGCKLGGLAVEGNRLVPFDRAAAHVGAPYQTSYIIHITHHTSHITHHTSHIYWHTPHISKTQTTKRKHTPPSPPLPSHPLSFLPLPSVQRMILLPGRCEVMPTAVASAGPSAVQPEVFSSCRWGRVCGLGLWGCVEFVGLGFARA